MKSADKKSFIYEKNQIVETICQLRFPAILSIETREPADFQEIIREEFPRYSCQEEAQPAQDGARKTIKNYNFISEDGRWKLNLTRDFIALSTVQYSGWESFAHRLDGALGNFIQIYKPAFFERVGLRYLNGFSREKLELTEFRWVDLIHPQYLGVLSSRNVNEADVSKCAVDVEQKLDDRCNLKLHAGPGSIRRAMRTDKGLQTVQEQETRFILDMDLYAGGKIPLADVAETLERLHNHADRVFSDAITDTLHNAMSPVEL